MTKIEKAKEQLEITPLAPLAEIAEHAGVSYRTARRAKAILKEEQMMGSGKKPRILLFDIETVPMEGLFWGLYLQKIPPENILKEWSIVSWAAKWLCDSSIMSMKVTPREAIDRRDKSIIKGLWKLLDEANIVIAHNARRFDIRKANARFLVNGLNPPMHYRVIDTLKKSQEMFAHSSHKIDYLNGLLNGSHKIKTDYGLWKKCTKGDVSALKYMEKYNRRDVSILEEFYFTIRPFIPSHPNLGLYTESNVPVCPTCGSKNIKPKGYYYTPAGRFRAFRCECGAIGRSRISALTPSERKRLILSVAK